MWSADGGRASSVLFRGRLQHLLLITAAAHTPILAQLLLISPNKNPLFEANFAYVSSPNVSLSA